MAEKGKAKSLIRNVTGAVGFGMLFAGLWQTAGWGWACIICGALLFVIAAASVATIRDGNSAA